MSSSKPSPAEKGRPANLLIRTVDGSYNDLEDPALGSVGSRYGRNVPPRHAWPERHPAILNPSPREVSRHLLTRDNFIPATSLNLLAACWLHFETEDWFSHGGYEREDAWQIEIDGSDPWPNRRLLIPRTRRDPTYDPASGLPPTYVTALTQWRDASQIYGGEFADTLRAREDGKLLIGPDGLPPRSLDRKLDVSLVNWLGLALLCTLFMLEHNAVCDRLCKKYPRWSDDQLYERARLVIAALIVKIHTVEWIPAMMNHRTARYAMAFNWWGLAGAKSGQRVRRLSAREVISGIPGSRRSHHGVPYSLTEEFVAVYRMHPLMPDHFTFRSVDGGEILPERSFPEVTGWQMRDCLTEVSLTNALYSFGIAHAGSLTLHNFPRSLQFMELGDGTLVDLAAADIMSIRERGVPRYNEFRRLFHRKPVSSFNELTGEPAWAAELADVYEGDIERVDLMIGLYSEPRPPGLALSDTAFRVLLLMTGRHLKSDRFLTSDYTARVYTQAGLDWIAENSMLTVLRRHFPQLESALRPVVNPFTPWPAPR